MQDIFKRKQAEAIIKQRIQAKQKNEQDIQDKYQETLSRHKNIGRKALAEKEKTEN
jgi:hypothetical protein